MTKGISMRTDATNVAPGISKEQVCAQLEKLLASDDFNRSERMKSFLRFVVSETLAGRSEDLKEYPIAVKVFDRDDSFDPNTTAIVRVEASRVRHRLREYFSGPGRTDQIHIALPIGTYIPEFTTQAAARAKHDAIGVSGESSAAKHDDLRTPLVLPEKPSIAVLPFTNLNGDPEQEYFADGVVEDLITALSRIRWLFVIARNSTFTFKGKAVKVQHVAKELERVAFNWPHIRQL